MGNGFVLDSNSMLKDLFTQSRLAILHNRTADYPVLSDFLNDLHCNNPFPRPGGGICLPPVAYPDLLPLKTQAGFCDRNAVGNLLTVTVYNGASAPASCTVVKVVFDTVPPTVEEREVVSVPAFGSTPVTIPIPSGCSTPDCNFKITVNNTNCPGKPKVIEAKRSNNTVSGTCIG